MNVYCITKFEYHHYYRASIYGTSSLLEEREIPMIVNDKYYFPKYGENFETLQKSLQKKADRKNEKQIKILFHLIFIMLVYFLYLIYIKIASLKFFALNHVLLMIIFMIYAILWNQYIEKFLVLVGVGFNASILGFIINREIENEGKKKALALILNGFFIIFIMMSQSIDD